MFDDFWAIAARHLPQLLRGAGLTMLISLIGVSIGLVAGILIGFVRAFRVPVASQIFRGYVDIIRGTPLLVQIFFIFFGIPTAMGVTLPPLTAGLTAIAINSSAYVSEVVRGAVNSIPKGQTEAARALGMGWFKTLRKVVWPQAFLVALSGLGNQFIISIKDTSLLAVISVEELTRNGQIIISATFRAFQIWLLVALIYLAITGVLSFLLSLLERRLSGYVAR